MCCRRHAAHAFLHELHRLVVLQAEEAGGAHQVALAQAVARHFRVVALVAEHGPLHDQLCGPFGTICRTPSVFISRWTIRFGQIVCMVTDQGCRTPRTKSRKRGSRSVMPSR